MALGTTNTLMGTQQKTLYVENEVVVIKDRAKVQDAATHPFTAGNIVKVTSAGLTVADGTSDTVGSAKFAVAYTTHTAAFTEAAGSGLATIVWDNHKGRTTQYNAASGTAYATGQKLYLGANGLFTNDGTLNSNANPHVGFVDSIEGSFLCYTWTGVNNEA